MTASKDDLLRRVTEVDAETRRSEDAAVESRDRLADAIRAAASHATVREIAEVCSLGRSRVGQIIKGSS